MGFLASSRFDGSSYNVMEEEGTVEVAVGVIEGSLGTEVRVQVTTIDISSGGAEGDTYCMYVNAHK